MKTGIIFGKFYPIHLGHIFMIEQSCAFLDKLVLFVGCDTKRDLELYQQSTMRSMPSPQQRVEWIKEIFKYNDKIEIHLLIEDGIPRYPNGWQRWAELVIEQLAKLNLTFDIIFSSEPQDVDLYMQYFGVETRIIDHRRNHFNISSTQVRNNPLANWDLIPHNVRGYFARNINIFGPNQIPNNQLSPENLALSLAKLFNTQVVLNQTYKVKDLQFQDNEQFENLRRNSQQVFFSDLSYQDFKQHNLSGDLFIVLINDLKKLNQAEIDFIEEISELGYTIKKVNYNQDPLRQIIKIVRSLIKYNLNLDLI